MQKKFIDSFFIIYSLFRQLKIIYRHLPTVNLRVISSNAWFLLKYQVPSISSLFHMSVLQCHDVSTGEIQNRRDMQCFFEFYVLRVNLTLSIQYNIGLVYIYNTRL